MNVFDSERKFFAIQNVIINSIIVHFEKKAHNETEPNKDTIVWKYFLQFLIKDII